MRFAKLRLASFVILCFAAWTLTLRATSALAAPATLTDAEIKTMLHDFIERDHWGVGIVVGIVDEHGTRIISYGKLDNGDSPEVNGDTLFELGSITKTFTTLLLEDMIQRGEMKLDDPVEKFLPASVTVPSWQGRKITLLDLATHTSGLPRDLEDWSVPGLYKFLSHYHLTRKPGTKAVYSNLGMSLLGYVIELKAGTNYESLVQQRICRPLGMDSTCIYPIPATRLRWAQSHSQDNRAVWNMDAFLTPLVGAGALRSSVNDMLKYAAAEIGLSHTPLTPLMEKTHALRVPHAFGVADLALPWWIYHLDGAELITHGGSTGGHKAFLGFDKQLKRAVVVLANRSDRYEQAIQYLGLTILHPPATRPVPVKVAAETLDSYAGLYVSAKASDGIMIVRRDGDQLNTRLIDAVSVNWVPQSKTEFALSTGQENMKFYRGLTGQQKVAILFEGKVVGRGQKISDYAPDSLLQPMLKPLDPAEWSPRAGSDLQGTWEGKAHLWFWPFHSQHGTVHIAESFPGNFRAEFDFSGANKQSLSVIYHPPGIELVLRSGDGMFKGEMNKDHTRITGRVYQGTHSLKVTLRRAGEQNDPALKKSF
jgi:D-alanyl-D-alanine-carboxypeptidase/D-alanyl-D-alanine-endopeptidase